MANHNQAGGIARIRNAMLYSLAGLRTAWNNEAAFRQELFLCIFLFPAAFWLGTNAAERAILIGSCMLVLITELLNSAVEATIDRIGADKHALSGRAKDLGSAAVFVSLWTVAICWGLIGYERFIG
ncbi:MAG: diacylglycerol kinase [Gammaproteobacteria bacterium]